MEDPQESAPKKSVMDELRAIQLDGDGGHAREEELLTPISPSDIINSVEQDPVENQEQASPNAPEGTSWAQDPMDAFLADSLGPRPGSASAADSNGASFANTTPASRTADQAPDMGMDVAFAATPFGRDLESRLHASVNDLATVSPAQLTGAGFDGLAGATFGKDSQVLAGIGSEQGLDTVMPDHHDSGLLTSEDTAPNEYLTALPPLARSRAELVSIIKDHRQEIESFNVLVSRGGGAARLADNKAIVKIDAMLQKLADISSLPPYHESLQGLSQEDWMRYARDTSSKLSFIYELLSYLRHVNMEIIILAAGGQIMDKVEAIVNQSNITYRFVQQQNSLSPAGQDSSSACKVVLVDTALKDSQPFLTGNLVVAYDESAEISGLLQRYKTKQLCDQRPMIFTLFEVYSLEHVNRRLPPGMDSLERRLAQIKCLELLVQYGEEDAVFEHVTPPHDLAGELAHYLVQEDTFSPPQVRWATWEHQTIPSAVLDAYEIFRKQLVQDPKRARETSSDGDEVPKRLRISSSSADEVQLSAAFKSYVGTDIPIKGGMAQVSVGKLEGLVSFACKLKTALDEKSKEVDDYAKTVRHFHPKYREATTDRAAFQAERDRAIKQLADCEHKLERTEAKLEKERLEKQQLEKLHERVQSDDQDVAQGAKIEIAELNFKSERESAARSLKSANAQIDYVQNGWRDASSKMGALRQENAALQVRIRDLETRANDNIVEIHRLNNEGMRDQLRTMYEQERSLRLDREKELERKNEELRNFKTRFGGRETRGSSVPRSPRIRQMSSRNTSPVGDIAGGGGGGGSGGSSNGNGGTGLGGGGTLFGPRGAHLRDG
ncbi:unnamed protein product [Discula destructiva]